MNIFKGGKKKKKKKKQRLFKNGRAIALRKRSSHVYIYF